VSIASATVAAPRVRAVTSFDGRAAVHFIGLVNVVDLRVAALGNLGAEQLAWLEDDLRGKSKSTPIVAVRPHPALDRFIPNGAGGTEDGGRALEYVKGFGSVTVLNAHSHTRWMPEGRGQTVTFPHAASLTAFPQHCRRGTAPSPGPMKVRGRKAPLHAPA